MKCRKRFFTFAWALIALFGTAGFSQAAVITSWDMANATPGAPTNVTDPGFVFDQYNYVEPGSLLDPNTGAVAEGGFMPSGYSKYAG